MVEVNDVQHIRLWTIMDLGLFISHMQSRYLVCLAQQNRTEHLNDLQNVSLQIKRIEITRFYSRLIRIVTILGYVSKLKIFSASTAINMLQYVNRLSTIRFGGFCPAAQYYSSRGCHEVRKRAENDIWAHVES